MGGLFVLAQVGADYGYIIVDHDKIKKDVEKKLDINQGEVLSCTISFLCYHVCIIFHVTMIVEGKTSDDKKDINVQKIAEKVMKVLSNNMPANSGFAIGAVMGWRGVGLT